MGKPWTPLEPRYDERLTAVTRALDNLKRLNDGSALTSGSFDAFPLPLVRLAGDADDLPLPLMPLAIDVIARRAESSANDHTLVIKHQDVELRNPRWEGFVEKIVESTRVPLGITDTAKLTVTLKEVVLVRAGGHLPVSSADSTTIQKHGRFGSLVVVLPGEFSGGEVAMTLAGSSDMKVETQRWNPERTDRDAFDIAYAAFCNDVSIVKTTAVTSGHALCLVYDLATTTIHELPRYADGHVLERQVQTVLSDFFFVPPPPAKRAKITEDAWRTISEFTTHHRFVYPVTANAFDELQGYEKQLFDQLKVFCGNSNGQFVLYMARLGHCAWNKPKDETEEITYSFTIRGPCLGWSLGQAEHDSDVSDDVDTAYKAYRIVVYNDGTCLCTLRHQYALVVQPATLEDGLWAKAPMQALLAKLDALVATAPAEASRIVRRHLESDPTWVDMSEDIAVFRKIVAALNDPQLERDFERSVRGAGQRLE